MREELLADHKEQALKAIAALPRLGANWLKSGIYFLLDGDDVIYVGQAKKLARRIAAQSSLIPFTDVAIINVPIDDLTFVENRFIELLDPPYNRRCLIYADAPPLGFAELARLREALP